MTMLDSSSPLTVTTDNVQMFEVRNDALDLGENVDDATPGHKGTAVDFKTPITVENLDSGSHEVVFAHPDGPVTLTVELGEGEFKKVHHSQSPDASDARVGE